MQQRLSSVERAVDALLSIRRDVAHAVRSLAKDRGFTLICVISLGIGMGAVVALATFNRAITAPARRINSGSQLGRAHAVGASAIAVSVAVLAGLSPARPASSVEPMTAMRSE
jgi:hypothetical protein